LHLHNQILRFPSAKVTATKYSNNAYFLSITAKIAAFLLVNHQNAVFWAQLIVSKYHLRGQNDPFDTVNLHVLPLLYAEKLIKLVKYSYRFTTSRNSDFHCVSESPMVI
jgi:hypothetical protein